MVGNEFAEPRSKFPWRSVEALQQPSPEGCAGAGPGLAAHPMVCVSIRPSIIFLREAGHRETILQPLSILEHRDSAAMGKAQGEENPSVPTALCRRLVPGQGSQQPVSPPGTEPAVALREEPSTPGPMPVTGTAEMSRWAEELHCQRSLEVSRRAGGGREEQAACPSQYWSTSATCLLVGEQAAHGAGSVSIFSPAQTKFVGSRLLANSLDQSRVW